MPLRKIHLASLVCAILLLSPLSAQAPPATTFTQKFQAYLKDRPNLTSRSPPESRWLDGGDRYTVLEASAADPRQPDLVAYDTASASAKS